MSLKINEVVFYYGYASGTIPIGSTVPVKKGDILTVGYENNTNTPQKHTFKFYYAVGTVPTA